MGNTNEKKSKNNDISEIDQINYVLQEIKYYLIIEAKKEQANLNQMEKELFDLIILKKRNKTEELAKASAIIGVIHKIKACNMLLNFSERLIQRLKLRKLLIIYFYINFFHISLKIKLFKKKKFKLCIFHFK